MLLVIWILLPYSRTAFADEPDARNAHQHERVIEAEPQTEHGDLESDPEPGGQWHEAHGQEAVLSMAERHVHMGPHFRWTMLRPENAADRRRADTIVASLRRALEPYKDYRKAMKDGYEPFLPSVLQPHYHFTSKWRGFTSAFRFNAEQPTSLLYKKTEQGYELEGAMFTAPKRLAEQDLHERIPLSVAQWHAHVHICLPPKREVKTADWKRFGPNGTILTEGDCHKVKGRWVTQLFGWMVHVYPYRDRPEAIWTH